MIGATRKYGECSIAQECDRDRCRNDVYVLHGWSENNLDLQFKALWFDSDDRRKFECALPLSKCKYDIDCVLDALKKEIERNSGKASVDIVGMSFGGMLAHIYAERHPDRVNKVGLITSFSRLHPLSIAVKKVTEPYYVDNAIEYAPSPDLKNDVLEFNCIPDRLVGYPPDVKNAKRYDQLFCVHGFLLPSEAREKIKIFMEER